MSVQGNASERLAGPVCYMSKERASCERSSFRARAPSGRPLARTGTRSLPHSPHALPGAIGPGPPTRRAGSRWPPPLFPGVSSVPGKLKTHPCGQAPTCPSREQSRDGTPLLPEAPACVSARAWLRCSRVGPHRPRPYVGLRPSVRAAWGPSLTS